MSALIAWTLIGFVFFFGIAMDHTRWTKHDVFMSVPCLIGVLLLWPFGLMHRAWYDYQRRIERNQQRSS